MNIYSTVSIPWLLRKNMSLQKIAWISKSIHRNQYSYFIIFPTKAFISNL